MKNPQDDLINWAWFQVAVECDTTEPREYEEQD